MSRGTCKDRQDAVGLGLRYQHTLSPKSRKSDTDASELDFGAFVFVKCSLEAGYTLPKAFGVRVGTGKPSPQNLIDCHKTQLEPKGGALS